MIFFDSALERLLKFQFVGLIGTAVQIAMLTILTEWFGIPYLISTTLAVEIAVIHNFCWHERWTWRSRITSDGSYTSRAQRFVRFNVTIGLFSLAANLILTATFVEIVHIPYVLANLLSIATASIANFVAADLYVFQPNASKSPYRKRDAGLSGRATDLNL